MTMPSTCVVLYPQQINGRERRSAIISLSPTTHCTPSTTTAQRYNSVYTCSCSRGTHPLHQRLKRRIATLLSSES
jgi:hypothetical protein